MPSRKALFMNPTFDHMLSLLRASLNDSPPDIPLLSTNEWEQLFWLARKHGVVTMINDAIERLPDNKQPQGDIALSWTLSAERTRYHYAHQAQVLESIDQKAQAEGIPYILLKGMSLSRYYPRPDSRPCGDIDICFPHHYQQGNALLGSPNAPTEGKHSEIVVDGVTVENHRQLLDLNYRSQKKAEEYIWKSIDNASSDHFLPPMADMVYLLMHTICHLTAKFKLPLRNIIDWGMFLRANRDTLKPAECNKLLRQLGMTDAFNMLTQLSSEFIGADLSMFISRPLPKKDITRMRELILTKKYLEPVPKNLPVLKYFLAKIKRHWQRRWLYRYLPSTRIERILTVARHIL